MIVPIQQGRQSVLAWLARARSLQRSQLMKKSRTSREEKKAALELKLARVRVLSAPSLANVVGGLHCDLSACNNGTCDGSRCGGGDD